MSATRLLVLGVVRMHGQAHGYRVIRELLSWKADQWANLQPGSVYHVLKKGATEGLLEPVELASKGNGPSRTAYRLTEDGEAEFHTLVEQYLSEPEALGYNISAAVTFITTLPRARAISLLEYLLTQLEGSARTVRHAAQGAREWGQPAHIDELYRLWIAHDEANLHWVRGLLGRLKDGAYVMADDEGSSFGAPAPE